MKYVVEIISVSKNAQERITQNKKVFYALLRNEKENVRKRFANSFIVLGTERYVGNIR